MTPGSPPPSDSSPDDALSPVMPPAEHLHPVEEGQITRLSAASTESEDGGTVSPEEFKSPTIDSDTEVHIVPESLRDDVPGAHFASDAQLTVHTAASAESPEPIVYEDDETSGTLLLRTFFTLLAGGFLLWGQWSSGVNAAEQWDTWVKGAVLANLVVPLGVIWLFFGQGLRTADWMREMERDPRYNAWNYGWKPRPFLRHFGFALACLVVMLPFLWYFSRDANTRLSYQLSFLPPTQTPGSLVRVLVGVTIYMLCWEWFFRGFLLFGLAQGLGKYGWAAAIVLQSILFYFAHSGKPLPEMYSSFGGGLLLGAVCWREKSFFPAFYTHWLIQIAWVLLMR